MGNKGLNIRKEPRGEDVYVLESLLVFTVERVHMCEGVATSTSLYAYVTALVAMFVFFFCVCGAEPHGRP